MNSTFKRNRHFRKVLVNKTFTHVQEQKKAMSLGHSAYSPSSVKSPEVLEAIKKQVSLKSYSPKIRIDSVNQILKNKEKVTQTCNMLTRITDSCL